MLNVDKKHLEKTHFCACVKNENLRGNSLRKMYRIETGNERQLADNILTILPNGTPPSEAFLFLYTL